MVAAITRPAHPYKYFPKAFQPLTLFQELIVPELTLEFMRMEQILLVVYILLTGWLIPFVPFVRQSGLPAQFTRMLYGLKILLGIGCAYYFATLSTNVDYVAFNNEGKIQYDLLLSNPGLFFTDFTADIKAYGFGGLFATTNSFWAYLRFNLLFKLIGILNLVTQGNFYFNTAVFSSFVFFGHLAFYRVFNGIYPSARWLVVLTTFFLPSTLLYTARFHKDGIVFLGLAVISYSFYTLLSAPKGKPVQYIFLLAAGFLALFLFRNYVLVALLPAMAVALLCNYFREKRVVVVLGAYTIFIALFFGSSYLGPVNLPAAVVQRKADFAALQAGRTDIPMRELSPGITGFTRNLPEALNHALLRPYLWEFPAPGVILTALEILAYQLVLLAFIFFRRKNTGPLHLFNVFGLALFFNMMLIIGYTIPNVGAIVRYRSIFWLFLLTPLVCNIAWSKMLRLVKPVASEA
jgi:hypothetical protein